MRFLLQAPRRLASKTPSKVSNERKAVRLETARVIQSSKTSNKVSAERTAGKTVRVIQSGQQQEEDAPIFNNGVPNSEQSNPIVKAWGQQCSPECGCVVRFESNIDTTTDTIGSDVKYYAKTVLSTRNNVSGKLEAQLTTKGRPILTDCSCKTLHELATHVTKALPSARMTLVRNMTEFQSVRSSPAFRHTVLAEHKLPTTDTHCFDVMEEAFFAMIRGHMPQPRRGGLRYRPYYQTQQPQHSEEEYDEEEKQRAASDAYLAGYGVDQSNMSMAFPHAMSALYMMDMDSEPATPLNDNKHGTQSSRETNEIGADRKVAAIRDWVSYVDEMYRVEEEKSA